MLICVVPIMEWDLLTNVGSSISFALPIWLTLDSPLVPPLLLLSTYPTGPYMSFTFLASQMDPQIWNTQKPSIARYHSCIIMQLRDPTQYIILFSTHYYSRALGHLNLSSLSSQWRKPNFILHFFLFNTLFLQLKNLMEHTA